MKYSRNKLNNTGEILISEIDDFFRYNDAMNIVDDWRKNHQVPMQELFRSVSSVLAEAGVQPSFSSQRLKRMTSIIGKLRRNPDMRLGGVQDIGGVRFVFPDIPTMERAYNLLYGVELPNFERANEPKNYVNKPKCSGYRSIHFVYIYHSANEDTDGLRIELQIRTKLQHDWATAVETAELISKSPLKAGIGDENWLRFFKLISAIFAREEGMPIPEQFSDFSEADYCREYAAMDKQGHYLMRLGSLIKAVDYTEQNSFEGGYALLMTDFELKKAKLRHFSEDEFSEANETYKNMESRLESTKGAIVLVSVKDMNELLEAYSSYFLNTSEFIDALSLFTRECFIKGYLKE
ncbi:MAG: RelA/SpoT domain-containing protein [Bacteroidales bacterium]|nr:RelA/SpoT domain-containing protein [Bacteroidales bacterium]